MELNDASKRETEYEFSIKGMPNSKSILLFIIERAIDFTNDYKQNIIPYKEPAKQQEIINITQKFLIVFYNILASYYHKASELESNETRDELHILANSYIDKAMKISYQESSTSIIRGYSSIESGKLDEAEKEFNQVTHQHNLDVLSLIGKAVVYYKKEQYEKALDQYKKIIRNNPLWPLSVYNASAIWFYKLGNAEHARLIFSKILEKDAENEIALWGMATVDNSNGPDYFQTLVKIFNINPNNPNICWVMGEIFLHREEFEKAENLANRGLLMIENLVNREVACRDLKYLQSNLLLLQGKLLHVRDEYSKAFKYYDDAVNAWDSNPVALHYLGTINMHLKNFAEAEK